MRIEKNQLLKKRWRTFKTCRRGIYSLWFLIGLSFFSATAEFWANDRPIVLVYKSQIYFPVVKYYPPSAFDLTQKMITVDYKNMELTEKDFALWPVIPWNPYESNTQVSEYPSPPTWMNWMGTDNRGRDVFSRILYGFRYSMGFAVLVWLGSFFIGAILGMVMGFKAGWVDLLGQRCVEVFQSLPHNLLLITFVAVLGSELWILILYSTVFGWMNISLYMRSEYLKIRNMDYIESAKSYGLRTFRIMVRHIFPNALTPLVTFSPFKIAAGVSLLVILDYLGFGLAPPTPSWGELLNQAESYFTTAWWLAFFPSLFLFLNLVSLNFIGEGIRMAFDPKAIMK